MRLLHGGFITVVLLSFVLGLAGCQQEGTAEKAGQKIDQAAEKAGKKRRGKRSGSRECRKSRRIHR